MEWLQIHWLEILAAVGAFDAFLFAFSKLTPWKWDDNFYSVIHKFFLLLLPKRK